MNSRKKEKIKKKRKINNIFSIVLLVVTITLLIFLHLTNLIPLFFYILIIVVLVVVDFILIKLFYNNGIKSKIAKVISIILIIGMIFGIFASKNVKKFFDNINSNYKEITFQVVVLDSSDYEKLSDLKNKSIGVLDTDEDEYNKGIDELNNKVDNKNKKCSDNNTLIELLYDEEIDAFLIEESKNKIIEDEDPEYKENTRVIETFVVKVELKDIVKKVDVENESFNVYISGIDTYGSINTVSRSDVNIVATINPKTYEIRFTSIPRDYYVKLRGFNKYDKLTHAGIYGIEKSVGSIEDLLDIDINYYVKVNFTSVIDIVDTIGPISIESNYTFTTKKYDDYTEEFTFYKGKNTLNGKEALAFSRERKSFNGGDRTRNENQQIVLKAIIDKVLTPSILTKYSSLLDTLGDNIVTNMDEDEITTFIKKQIDSNAKWDITSYVLDGYDAMDYTYSYGGYKLYVMKANEESVEKAKEEIKKILQNN